MTGVLIADDHALFRAGVRLLLEREGFEVLGEAADGPATVRLAAELSPDVILLDLSMPGLTGIEAAQLIRSAQSKTKIIMLTMYNDEAFMLEALHAGMSGFVLKARSAIELVFAIREAIRGAFYLGPDIPKTVIDALTNNTSLPSQSLSTREKQVVGLVSMGVSTKQIGVQLGLSPKTIESHRSRIMQKLGFTQTSQLVRYAVRLQMIRA